MRRNLYPLVVALSIAASHLPAAILTVTTPDNASGPDDGQLSLFEAIRSARAGDTIGFNLPGPGPHLIATPLGGYPFITADDLTIDGYSQPGSAPNTQSFAQGNNAQLRIVLDSRSDEAQDSPLPEQPELVVRRSTRMLQEDASAISGYGPSENGILAVLGAQRVTIRGLCFLARHTAGNKLDPDIYCVALARGAAHAKIQGCWFGLHPDRTTVTGGRSAVAAFRYIQTVGEQSVGIASSDLVFGTDGDGVNDRAERNISLGMTLAVAIELPGARISGNYFNVFPDGNTFLDIGQFTGDRGLSTLESFENGRFRENTLIGTDGDGVSDAEERNVFAPSRYDHIFEFYGGNSGTNIVIAGNHFGVGVDGSTLYPFEPTGAPDFFQISGAGSVRIGSNGDGISDALEGNRIYGIGGDQLADATLVVPVVARGNWIQGCGFVGFPFKNRDKGRDYDTYYANALLGPLSDEALVKPVLVDAFEGFLSGSVPNPNLQNYPYSLIDLYLADQERAEEGNLFPGTYLGTFVEGSTQDRNGAPGEFRFNLAPFTIPAGGELLAVVTYTTRPDRTEPDFALTGPASEAAPVTEALAGTPLEPPRLAVAKKLDALELSWPGLEGLYRLETTDDPEAGPWRAVASGGEFDGVTRVTANPASSAGYFRLRSP